MTEEQLTIATLQQKIAQYETILHDMAAPIIPSFFDNAILIPLSGYLFLERVHIINETIYDYVGKNRQVDCIIMDLTGIRLSNIHDVISTKNFGKQLQELNETLKLMGIRVIYSSFHPELVEHFVRTGLTVSLETFPTYRHAILSLLKENPDVFKNLL